MVLGRSGGSAIVALASISGASGTSGGYTAITGLGAAGGGTNALGGLRNQQDVEPNDSTTSSGNTRKLAMVYQRGELQPERRPAAVTHEVDSTIMQLNRPICQRQTNS